MNDMTDNLNRLKVVLAEKNKTNKWLAEELHCGQATVSKWCTNRSQPDLATLIKLAKLLGVEITDLIRQDALHGQRDNVEY